MGNSVSAEAAFNSSPVGVNANPPPECPMHQKTEQKQESKPSECPVQHGQDINPYNMVNKHLLVDKFNKSSE